MKEKNIYKRKKIKEDFIIFSAFPPFILRFVIEKKRIKKCGTKREKRDD